ncbi:MAG: hypothetical protein JSR85_05270 [Proteobacteria bacterium]|nr:hypothetical protein [Pseudomonadota bacterium]
MKKKNFTNQILGTISFITFLTCNNMVQACSCPPSNGPGYTRCCGTLGDCCECCLPDDTSSPGLPPKMRTLPKITAEDIFTYATSEEKQKEVNKTWTVLRGNTSNDVPISITDIGEDITVTDLKDGRYTVSYTVNGKPQSVTISHK